MTAAGTTSLRELSYFGTGGAVDVLFSPGSVDELAAALAEIKKRRLPFFLLGAGTNSLIMDEHWPGAVISFHKLNHMTVTDHEMECEAGVLNDDIAGECRRRELAGAAWMHQLPGQIGATVRMNARCYGGEISTIVERVETLTLDGTARAYEDQTPFRGYKDTAFMDSGEIIARVALSFKPGNANQIETDMEACADDRSSKGHFLHPSCGCVFKNDHSIGVPSGKLLDAAGAKDLTVGGAEVNPLHANFIFNKGATAEEILELSLKMRSRVYEKFGVWLSFEMEILGKVPAGFADSVAQSRPHKPGSKALRLLQDEFRRSQS